MTVKVTKPYTGKKSPTNPEHKEAHQNRKAKKEILHHIHDDDWEQQLKEYYATTTIQE